MPPSIGSRREEMIPKMKIQLNGRTQIRIESQNFGVLEKGYSREMKKEGEK